MAKGTVNKVILLGRLGANPEIRQTQNGTVVATLSLATNDGIGDNITTEWHRVIIFGKAAEVIKEHCKKGSQLFVEGRIRTNKWQDKSGKDQYTTEIVASNFQFIGGGERREQPPIKEDSGDYLKTKGNKPSQQMSQQNQHTQQPNYVPGFDEVNNTSFDDDIPF